MKTEEFNAKWNIHKVVQDAVEKAHSGPSPQTLSELANIKRDLAENDKAHNLIMEKLDEFGEKLERIEIKLAELPDKIFERADRRYASKETEDALRRLNWIVITAVVVALLGLVLIEFK